MSDRPNGGNAGTGPNGKSGSSGGAKALKRYGPIVAILVVIGIIVAIAAGGSGDDDDSNKVETGNTGGSNSNLPITFQEAQQQGKDIDFGPNCDTTTGRIKVPTLGAPQCVEPWDSSKDNGGSTYEGVTKDAIKVAIYVGQNDPLQQALVEGAGASTNPGDYYKTAVDYVHAFEQRTELYGRKIQIVRVNATGGPDDSAAARADAIKITKEIKPFAVLGGPAQAPEFWQTIAKSKIMCIGNCSVAEGEKNINDNAPYAWPAAIAPEQADQLWAELIEKQLIGKKAEFAGDAALKSKDRVFGYIQAETEQGEYKARNDAFLKTIEDKGAKVAARTSYIFDPAQAQNIARTVINKMKSAGVTSILLSADPLIPANLTQEATAQDYFPEWVIGPSVFVDTTVFGRTYDQKQWVHAFGLSVLSARGPRVESESYGVYKWATGKEPPVNAQAIPYANVAYLMIGLQLAGPDLTPDTYKEGMFRYLPAKSSATRPQISWGTKLWKNGPDYHSSDDGTIIWWDPNAKNVEDEVGNTGTGAYRYFDMGKRYLPGDWPDSPVKFFDNANTVTVFEHRPADDTPPDYPPLAK
jgi:hypothetical protein